MMIKLERDRLRSQVKVLEEQVRKLQEEQPADNRDKTQPKTQQRSATRAVRQHAEFPPRGSVKNPFLGLQFPPASFDQMVTRKTHKAHVSAISGCAFHPKKPTFATASDDGPLGLRSMKGGRGGTERRKPAI